MKNIIFTFAMAINILSLSAQNFVDITPTSFVQSVANYPSSASGDINGDGLLDIIVTGNKSGAKTWIYLNNGNGGFDLAANTGINTGYIHSSIDLGDYDGDNDLDIVVQGYDAVGQAAYVYKNDGLGFFTVADTLRGRSNGNVQWGDYNNDGRLDILQTGFQTADTKGGYTTIYRNDSNDIFTEISTPTLKGIADGQAKWADLNKDGNLDIALVGWNATKIYLGDGQGSFTEKSNTLPAYDMSFVNTVDYDKDGNTDLVFGGHIAATSNPREYETKVAKGDGLGNFTLTDISLTGVQKGPVTMGDCNNDGYNDFFIAGWNNAGFFSVFKNDGTNNVFSDVPEINSLITGWADGTMQVQDFDGDGYSEIFKCGWNATKLYKNILPLTAFDINIDDYRYQSLEKSKIKHTIHLPYTYTSTPIITPIDDSEDFNYAIINAEDINGTEAQRTATVTVTPVTGGVSTSYNLTFEILPKLDLFLCIGQSNMAGTAPIDTSLGDNDPIENSYLFNSLNLFESAENPLNKFSNVRVLTHPLLVGPTNSFAKEIGSVSSNPIGLVVNARGASAIESWMKVGGTPDTLYAPTMRRALEAQKWGEYKAILWHQGEANSADYINYPTKLQTLVTALREDLGDPNLLFVAGQIGQWRSDQDDFNNMIKGISSIIPNSACALSTDLTNVDVWHFDRPSIAILGERYAEIVHENIYSTTQNQELQLSSNKIYVNDNKLTINLAEDNGINTIEVFHLSGSLLKSVNFSGKTAEIQLSDLSKGVYLVRVKNTKNDETLKISL